MSQQKAIKVNPQDGRHSNNSHRAVAAAGAEAARQGAGVHHCPYDHPSMRASWLKGYAAEQQQEFAF